jgi:hypothetical protein
MKKYYVGMLVIGLIVLGLSGYVISMGMSAKADKKTFKTSQEIAEDLNAYVRTKKAIPDSLEEAGIKDVPSSIRYQKMTGGTYEFCVTYKADKSYGSADVGSVLYGAALGGAINDSTYERYQSDYTSSTLYINYYYQKGENCQTVKPIIRSSSSSSRNNNSLYDIYCTGSNSSRYETYCASLEENSSSESELNEL